MSYKNKDSYKTISEVVEILNKNNLKNYENHTHTIRYWETQFKQIKPKKINNRRYYNTNDINILLKIQYLLKDQGMTINGVRKILDHKETLKLDEITNASINANNLKTKLQKISSIIKNLKKIK